MYESKRNSMKFAVALALLLLHPGLSSGATVDEIIAKFIVATGGREAQEAVTSMIREGRLDYVDAGMQIELVVHHKNGKRMTPEKVMEPMDTIGDGKITMPGATPRAVSRRAQFRHMNERQHS